MAYDHERRRLQTLRAQRQKRRGIQPAKHGYKPTFGYNPAGTLGGKGPWGHDPRRWISGGVGGGESKLIGNTRSKRAAIRRNRNVKPGTSRATTRSITRSPKPVYGSSNPYKKRKK